MSEKKLTLIVYPDLPDDVIDDILSRLPIKLLVKFMIICKTWQSLIESPCFISMHLKQNPDPNPSSSFLVLQRKKILEDYYVEKHMSLRSGDERVMPITLDFAFLREDSFIRIVGVSYGLACVRISRTASDLVICNPSTRQFYNIRAFETYYRTLSFSDADVAFGFIFDPSVDDYKVIKLARLYGKQDLVEDQAWIYTMSTDCWRQIDIQSPIDEDIRWNDDPHMAIVGKVICWLCYYSSSDYQVILSFDMSNESFKVIPVPQDFSCFGSDNHAEFYICQIEEELAFFGISNVGFLALRTMDKDCGSWNMKVSINLMSEVATKFEVGELATLGYVGRGSYSGVVIKVNKDEYPTNTGPKLIFLYDLLSGEIKRLSFGEEGCFYEVNWYTESLLPVKNNGFV